MVKLETLTADRVDLDQSQRPAALRSINRPEDHVPR
jgi:hypothetical protein